MPRFRSLLFFLFLSILGGVFLFFLNANRNHQRPTPAWAVWSPPDKPVRVVSFNIQHSQRGNRAVLDEIAKLNADFALLQEVEKSDLTALSEAFSDIPAIYHASENLAGRRVSWGNAIFSRYPLYDAGAIPHADSGAFGVWATALVGDKKFKLASVHLKEGEAGSAELARLILEERNANSAPMIVGGDFGQSSQNKIAVGLDLPWRDALTAIGMTHSGRLFISTQWRVMDAGIAGDETSSHNPVWLLTGK